MDPDYCSIPEGFLQLELGDQVRVKFEQELAVFTVQSFSISSSAELNANKRLGAGQSQAVLQCEFQGPIIVNESITSVAEAKARGELIEYVVDNFEQSSRLVCIAVHGGKIDVGTDLQAEQVAAALPLASLWICRGYRKGGGAFTRWHVTSNDISPNSFPALKQLSAHRPGFDCCISFHGMHTGGVLIGGSAPLEWKERLLTLIVDCINSKEGFNLDPVTVRIATWEDANNGLSERNVCNWLTKECAGGIQLEQDLYVREKYAAEVVQAVVQFAKEQQQF